MFTVDHNNSPMIIQWVNVHDEVFLATYRDNCGEFYTIIMMKIINTAQH